MKKFEAKLKEIERRTGSPMKPVVVVTIFSDGTRALGIGRGTLLSEEEYQKMTERNHVILIDWSEPYEVNDAEKAEITQREERRNDREGDSGGEEKITMGDNGNRLKKEENSFDTLLARIRARRDEKA